MDRKPIYVLEIESTSLGMLIIIANIRCFTLNLQKLVSQSVNSLLALRMMGRGNSLPPGGLRGGRGGMERGRGRGNPAHASNSLVYFNMKIIVPR